MVSLTIIKSSLQSKNLHFTSGTPKTKYNRDYPKFDTDYVSSEVSLRLDSIFCFIKENEDWKELYEFSQIHRAFLNLPN